MDIYELALDLLEQLDETNKSLVSAIMILDEIIKQLET